MSMQPQIIPPVPPDTANFARAAFPKGNLYMQIRDTLGTIYEDEAFTPLFCRRGWFLRILWRDLKATAGNRSSNWQSVDFVTSSHDTQSR